MRLRFLIAFFLTCALTLGAKVYESQTVSASQSRPPSDGGAFWSAYGTKTNTSDLQIQAAPGTGLSVYVYMAYCINTSASTQSMATITSGGTVRAVISCGPAGIYNKPTYFEAPFKMPQNTAVTMQAVASATTVYLFAAGTTAR